ncbi:MAG: hypothetical protein PUJ51_22140 [Clostridiales bacterium]|nr:hypothetical protein [Terrisporobacter sp.]MDD7757157.1 hypothetical protein [Clostridiales bacterium]MDY3801821.1 hypothetical protein [Bacilli bacterium]MDY4137673.1 hypothetical protein [Terrisporobacter sp.]
MKEKIKCFYKAIEKDRKLTNLFIVIVCISLLALLVILSIVR